MLEARLSMEELRVRMNMLYPSQKTDEEEAVRELKDTHEQIGLIYCKVQQLCEKLLQKPDHLGNDKIEELRSLAIKSEENILSLNKRIDSIREAIYSYESGKTTGTIQLEKFESLEKSDSKTGLPPLDYSAKEAVKATVNSGKINEISYSFATVTNKAQGVSVLDVNQIKINLDNNRRIANLLMQGKLSVEQAKEKLLSISHMEKTAAKVHDVAMSIFANMRL